MLHDTHCISLALQALAYFYYYTPFFTAAIFCLLYPGQTWIKDLSVMFAGGTVQAQLVYIWCSIRTLTPEEFRVPETILAQSIFWPVNLSLVIVPHLFAVYCHRHELAEFWSRDVSPTFGKIHGEVKTSQIKARKVQVTPHNGPVTRQQKKIM